MKRIYTLLALMFFTSAPYAQDRFAGVEVKAQPVSKSVYMLTGAGGNIGVSVGNDGVLMIDDQFEPLAEKILDALASLSEAKPRFIVNTHYHGDHIGSNAYFAEKHGVTVFAHENVRIRLADGEEVDPQSLPVVTYQDGIKFHLNDEIVHVFYLPDAHTDGDSAIWFEKANVLHTGDLFFHDMFPYIDLGAGGNVLGYMQAIDLLIEKINDETKIIPGHGVLATKPDLQRTLNMIEETYGFVKSKKAEGMSEQQIIDAGLDPKWDDWSWRFITTERWIKTLYQ